MYDAPQWRDRIAQAPEVLGIEHLFFPLIKTLIWAIILLIK